MTIKPEGFSEAGISTRDIEGWVAFFTQIGGYKEVWRGESPRSIKGLWQTPREETVLECLLENPAHDTGYMRLFQFSNIPQEAIRSGAHTWDSGGIFDIDLRARELLPVYRDIKQLGWKGLSPEPVDWLFSQWTVREWVVEGPDAVTIALMERLHPPLESWEGTSRLGHVFNSSQTVADMDRALDFYGKLGFIKALHHTGPFPGQGGEVLGLAPDIAPVTPVELVIIQPHGVVNGSVELIKIEGVPGRDFSHQGKPYNLGLNLLRFPVSDLRAYAAQIKSLGITPVAGGIVSTRIEPFGETEIMAVETPDGAWLEFYQAFD